MTELVDLPWTNGGELKEDIKAALAKWEAVRTQDLPQKTPVVKEMLHLLSVQGKALREDYRAGLGETFLAAEIRLSWLFSPPLLHELAHTGLFAPQSRKTLLDTILQGPTLLTELHKMEPNQNSTLELTKRQCHLLISLSFFNMIRKYPFITMFRAWEEYNEDPAWGDKKVTIERRILEQSPKWKSSKKTIQGLDVTNKRVGIEDFRNSVQVNFADPKPGGTLPSMYPDIVQEEILFLLYPELFVVPLVVDLINDREALLFGGAQRCNNYTGYQESFQWNGRFTGDKLDCSILFMDAVKSGITTKRELDREANKAYVAFSCDTKGKKIATGNWGCGAFGGSPKYKVIVQLIAAAQAQRDLEYTTFGTNDVKGIEKFHKYLVENKVTVGSLYNQLVGLMKYAKSPRFFELVIKGLEKEGNDGEEEKEKLPRLMQSVARKRNGDDTVSGEEEPALKEKKPSTKRETNNSNNKSPQKANKQTVPPPSQSIHSMPTRSSKRKVEGMNETESAEPKRKKAKQ